MGRLIPIEAAIAFGLALSIEKTWQESSEMTGGKWPEGHCVEASMMLRDELRDKFPTCQPEFVWGQFIVRDRGFDHAWIELKCEAILDMTAGQFFKDSDALMLILPTDDLANRYEEVERDPGWAEEGLVAEAVS